MGVSWTVSDSQWFLGLENVHMLILSVLVIGASLVAQTVKNLPAMQETWVLSLGQEDPLKKGMATHSSILTWRISWAEEPGGLQPMGSQRVSVYRRSQSASVLYHGCFARAHPPNLTHPQPVTPQSPSS